MAAKAKSAAVLAKEAADAAAAGTLSDSFEDAGSASHLHICIHENRIRGGKYLEQMLGTCNMN